MKKIAAISVFIFSVVTSTAQALYEFPASVESRLSSFENINGEPGKGATSNSGYKGHAFERLLPGETKILLDADGEGTIRRIWATMQYSAYHLRSIRIRMCWDRSAKPAVDVPFGDFFMQPLGNGRRFENALFTNGEGRSFVSYIPMPYRKHARIELVNEGRDTFSLFFDVAFNLEKLPASAGYFHCYWSRQKDSLPGRDLEVLPGISGRGRFLGVSVGLQTDSLYDKTWWSEGEVKMFIDGDSLHPRWVGSGAEDYIGSAWGLGEFVNQYQGCTYASEKERKFAFYRLHVPDPVYFSKSIHITWQQIGGGDDETVRRMILAGVPMIPVSVDNGKDFVRLMEPGAPKPGERGLPQGWINFCRKEDYAITSYFYIDKPSSNLPALAPVEERVR